MFTIEDNNPSVFKIHERKFAIYEVFTFASISVYLFLIYLVVSHMIAETKKVGEERSDSKRNKRE